ncbi:MAG: phage tail protein [Clostridia bacterium]|nr:phage tail protein [Clostridia bacterium]
MEIPEAILVKTHDGKLRAYLSPEQDGLTNCYCDTRLNGESTLEFKLPATSKKLAEITPDCTIWAGGRVYTPYRDETMDIERTADNKLWANITAQERWVELDAMFVEPYLSNDPNTPVPSDLTFMVVGGGNDLSGGRYAVGTAGHAMYAALNGSGWAVGTVDVPGIHDIETEKVSRFQIVKEIQSIWGGYIVWDSVNKVVHLRSEAAWQNYTGFEIRYRKNLKHITRTQSNRLITKLYCFGKDDLDIASVNGGQKFLTDHSYTAREYTGIYRAPDVEDPQELMDMARAELSFNCKPRHMYQVGMVDLRTLPEYEHEDFALGDMVDICDPDVGTARARINRYKFNVFKPWECELELGDPHENFFAALKASFTTTGYLDETLTSRGQLSGYKLVDGSVEDMKIVSLTADKITAGTITALISIVSPTILGGLVQGTIIRTAAEGNVRLEIKSNGFTGYNGLNQKEGISIETGNFGYSALRFYAHNALSMGGLVYDTLGGLTLFSDSGGNILIDPRSGIAIPKGVWECSDARFTDLYDENGNRYATESYAAQKGASTSSDTHSHTITINGQTYTTSSSSHSHSQE